MFGLAVSVAAIGALCLALPMTMTILDTHKNPFIRVGLARVRKSSGKAKGEPDGGH